MIEGIDYNNPINLQLFIEKLSQDEMQLNQIQSKVDKLKQNIVLNSNPQQLFALKESVRLLQSSLDTFNGDFQLLRQISKKEELINKVEQIFRNDIFTVIDDKRGKINKASTTLDEVNKSHPHLETLELSSSELQKNQAILLLSLMSKKDVLVEKDFLEIERIIKYDPKILFEKTDIEDSVFEQFMKSPHAHPIFDQIMFLVGEQFYLTQAKELQQILIFAFSRKRYEQCYAQDSQVSSETALKGLKVLEKCKVDGLAEKMHTFQSQRYETFQNWQLKRMGTSNTLTHGYSNQNLVRENWFKAEAYTLAKAHNHANTGTQISRGLMESIHKIMATGDQEITQPGVTRDNIGSGVAVGSSWMNNMCAARFLSDRLNELTDWMNDGFKLCNNEEKNPVIFAAQVYQRVVSLHPFENGNGRIARLMMDYVLVRYNMPPIVMGKNEKDVNIAIFPLLPDSTRNPNEFYNNMLKRISQSFDEFTKLSQAIV